ncbi:tRNA (adenosine(37)-N6)-threonylcarbamoyltransferase complex dimerization subunit type 1 TsaB [Algicola sagamiensis]|uniref:tRNA (adenosine(37)-N6)-threonylcarbamoyltransferase complex dimerization subunit type 1 TsaB n=1 Tax=Algicola sagamiensis TaxID=163869 RepID=UPI0003624B9B|nr:tRNA (adenosine(37)-N6)-threonylcarbamoyltransferase complex dimerization subunit type 1 TsaB [Algicola sagamiensis]
MSTKILAIDAATEACSVALLTQEQTVSRFEVIPQQHSQRLLPMVDEVLQEANMTLSDVSAIAFGRGPGSFTGVRIGVGIAQGLAFGANLPMVPVSSLEAMAEGAYREHGAEQVIAAIDARMGEIYTATYQRQDTGEWLCLDPECVMKPEDAEFSLSEATVVGTGFETYQDILMAKGQFMQSDRILLPAALDMVTLAARYFVKGQTVRAEEAEPVYVRDTVTWKKLPGRE